MSIEINMLSKLDESAKIVFLALLDEAEMRVRKRVKYGSSSNQSNAIAFITEDLSLTPVEVEVLIERLKKPDPISKTEIINNSPTNVTETSDRKNVIYFENNEDLDEAAKILMDKSIDWSEKDSNDNQSFIQFSGNDKLSEAHSALRRKYDFVESRKRLVADIQFDNLANYTKVLEFMRRQGMLCEFNSDIELDEDYDQLQNRTVEDQSVEGVIAPPIPVVENMTSFVAKIRSPRQNSRINPMKESKFRAAYVRRKFHIK